MNHPQIDKLLLRLISNVELFRGIDIEHVTALLRQATRINFDTDDLVFEEGTEGQSMYIVTQGAFEVFREVGGRHVHIARIEPGEHFGEIALLANRPRSASVRALEPSVAIRLSKRAVLAEQQAAVQLYRNMAQLMAKRLVHLDEEVILHKTGQHPLYQPAGKHSDAAAGSTGGYAVVRR